MKKYLITSYLLTFMVFFFPWLAAEPVPSTSDSPPETAELSQPAEDSSAENPSPAVVPAGPLDRRMILRVLVGGEVREMDMGTYLAGVVRAEMPAVFEIEALKAQAVAARTYTLYKMENGGSVNHPEADTCDDINCCKAYRDAAEAAASWGENSSAYEEKIQTAVRDTDGQCVLYEGAPVLAVFHSSSAGATLDAANVWSAAVPYLVSVPSPESGESVPNYRTSATFTISALKALLHAALPEADFSASPTDWFTNLRQTPGGAVTALDVGGTEISGNRLRTILGLRSPAFTFTFSGDSVTFTVTGYGHGVGMSQYGANVLAADGMDYREILSWYYTGTTVAVYSL